MDQPFRDYNETDILYLLMTYVNFSSGQDMYYSIAKTTILVYVGGVDQTSKWTLSATASSGLTGTLNGKEYSVSAMTTNTGKVTITAKKDNLTLSKEFTISKAKAGASGGNGIGIKSVTEKFAVSTVPFKFALAAGFATTQGE